MEWEYNTINFPEYLRTTLDSRYADDEIDRVLDEFGKDGWELAGICRNKWFIFKRQKTED